MGGIGVFGDCDYHGETLKTEIDYLLKIKVIFIINVSLFWSRGFLRVMVRLFDRPKTFQDRDTIFLNLGAFLMIDNTFYRSRDTFYLNDSLTFSRALSKDLGLFDIGGTF